MHPTLDIRPSLLLAGVAIAAAVTGAARADRLLGISFVDEVIFKVDTDTGEIVKFFGHPINQLGGLDVDSAGNVYYQATGTLWKLDLDQPANDVYVGDTPKVIFESFEIIDDVGYSGEVFTGLFYEINLATGLATPIGQYGTGGFDRITGLASTDFPGSAGPLHLYGVRVFQDDIIEIDPATGANLGVFIEDPALGVTNLAMGPGPTFWFANGQTLYRLDLASDGGLATPVFDLDVSGVDGLTLVDPEPSIVTDALPDGTVDDPYGPVTLEAEGGGPGMQWVALAEAYAESDLGFNGWELVGTSQNLTGDDVVMSYALPFPFPYYGDSYAQVWICNNGFIDFTGPDTNPDNGDAAIIASKRIAPLWDDLRTDFGGRDVFIDASEPGAVTIRWDALEAADFGVVNFSCTLHETGAIDFHYWLPNASITPTVGISAGTGLAFVLSQYNGLTNLHTVDSVRFEPSGGLPPGLALAADGTLSGTPTKAGAYTVTVRLTDDFGGLDEQDLDIEISELPPCVADLTGPNGTPDGTVDGTDLGFLLGSWGPGGAGDITGPDGEPDGVVDGADLGALLGAWGDC